MGGVAWWAIHLFTAPSFGFAAASIAVCPSGTFECSPTSHAAPHSTIPLPAAEPAEEAAAPLFRGCHGSPKC